MDNEIQNASFLDLIIEKGISFLLLFTPLAFGTVQPWSIAVMEIAAFVIFGAWLLTVWNNGRSILSKPAFLAPLAAFIALVLFQLLPLPPAVLSLLSPATADLYDRFAPSGGDAWHPITVYPGATREELYKLLSYTAVFIVIIHHYRTREQIRSITRTIVLMGLFLAVFAVVQKMTWNDRLFWFYPVSEGLNPLGPYINRNHFAGYLEMAVPLGLGMLLERASRIGLPHQLTLVQKIGFAARTEQFASVVRLCLIVLVMVGAVFFSLSRGGILGLICAIIFFFALARTRQSLREKSAVIVMVGLLAFVFVVIASWGRIEGRFEEIGDEAKFKRPQIWMDAIGLVRDFPVWGTGLGTFADAFPRYQSRYSTVLFEHAENDYIEVLTDAGLIGFALIASIVVLFFKVLIREWRNRRSMFVKCYGVGGIAAGVAIAVHGLTDFNMRIPANALLLSIIGGITYVTVVKSQGIADD